MSSIVVAAGRRWLWWIALFLCAVAVGAGAAWILVGSSHGAGLESGAETGAAPGKPALTVTVTQPDRREWRRPLAASGNIAAWQEAVIGAEISGYRLTEVLVDVGDRVRKGQLLVKIASETVEADLAQAKAAVSEAEAMLAEARADGNRARRSRGTSALSAQQSDQYLAAEQSALARLEAAKARVLSEEVRLRQTQVLAPDDGVVSARSATPGSLAQPGEELLRVIRDGRLEWRCEVPAADMGRLAVGGSATIFAPDGSRIGGRIRVIAPTVDPERLIGLVYVDVPTADAGSALRAGMFARGELDLGTASAMTLPQRAVSLRDGFAYVLRLEPTGTVARTKVQLGRRLADRVEIVSGLDSETVVIDSGVGFLADGDLVRVVDAPPPVTPPATAGTDSNGAGETVTR